MKFIICFLFLSTRCFSLSIDNLSLEEKIGQLLIVHFQGDEVNEEAISLIQDLHVGGFIYYNWANSLSSPDQVISLSRGLQSVAKIPLLISVDQEGGKVARLEEGFTKFLGNAALGKIQSSQLTYDCALAIGEELRYVGVNFNLAPVVDVKSKKGKSIIGVRSFGEDPLLVSLLGKAAIDGYLEAGVFSCLKHFPGHGDVEVDSHLDLPFLRKTKEELLKEDLLPFKVLAPFADAVMTAHIRVPSLDDKKCATLSAPILSVLREEFGFRGVIISDSLVMQGVLKEAGSVEQAAIEAIKAGCDLLILGGKLLSGTYGGLELKPSDVQSVFKALINAVLKGEIPEERVNKSVERIFVLKRKMNLSQPEEMGRERHEALAKDIELLVGD